MNGLLNHSLRPDGSFDLNNSVTARDRRRKHNDSVSFYKKNLEFMKPRIFRFSGEKKYYAI